MKDLTQGSVPSSPKATHGGANSFEHAGRIVDATLAYKGSDDGLGHRHLVHMYAFLAIAWRCRPFICWLISIGWDTLGKEAIAAVGCAGQHHDDVPGAYPNARLWAQTT